MAVDSEDIEIEEREEYVDGELCRVRRTIKRNVIEEVVVVEEPESITLAEEEHAEPEEEVVEVAEPDYETPSFVDHLVCQCQTPSGNTAFCLVTDNQDGTYTVDINASEPGVHTVDVELDGAKIPGSPFLVRIVQAADKKKVLLYGNGLNSGVLDECESIIHVDTKGAGPGDLKVRIHGPKNGFSVTMDHDLHDNRIVNVNYNPTVAGIYTINVYWSGEHVAGSPCEVYMAPNSDFLTTWQNEPDTIREEEGLSDKY